MAWKRIATIVLAAIMAWALSQDQDQSQQQQAQMQQQEQAAIRVAHLAVGAPSVQVTFNGETHFRTVDAETLSDYILVPAGEHQIEIRAAQDGMQDGQDGQQADQDAQEQAQVQQGEVPEEVRQAIQDADEALQQDSEQASDALDNAAQQIESAIDDADADALPLFEALQASINEAQEALANDNQQLAQESVTQAMELMERGQQTGQDSEQAQDDQEQDGPQALYSETVTLEAGSYYTVLASTTHEPIDMEMQSQVAESGEAQQDQQQEDRASMQAQDVEVRVLEDDVQAAPAGMALLRVIHASSDAPTLNLVMMHDQAGQQQDGQQQDADQDMQDDAQEGQEDQDEQQDAQEGEQDEQEQTDAEQEEQEQTDSEQDAQEGEQEETGELTITIQPDHASNASVNVTGPDGFERELTGGDTLTDLRAGSYVVGATLAGYQQSSQEVDIEPGQSATVDITMDRLPVFGPAPIEGQTFVEGLAANTASEYVTVPAGNYTAQLRAADQDLTAVELQGLTLEPGATYTVIAYGSIADDTFNVSVSVDALVPQGRDDAQEGQQDGERDGQPSEDQDDRDDAQDMQAMQDEVQQGLENARTAIDNENTEEARTALQEVQDMLASMAQNAEQATQDAVQSAQESLQNALDAVDNGVWEDARNALDQVSDDLGF